MLPRLLNYLRTHVPLLDTFLTVHERVSVVGGGPLTSGIALATFLSLFPLMLVGIAVMGWISADDVNFAKEVIERLGLDGTAERTVLDAISTAEASRRTATVVGIVGLVWAGLAVVGALEAALNATWQVQGRGITGKLRQVGWLLGAGGLFLASISLGPLLNVLPGPAVVSSLLVGLVVDTLLCFWTFQQLTNAQVPRRAHLPGAILGGVGLGVLKLVGGVYVPRLVASSSALYGSIGVVFALLAWLILGAKLLVYTSAYNVIRFERTYGTVTVDIEVPQFEGQSPQHATRGGAVANGEPEPTPA